MKRTLTTIAVAAVMLCGVMATPASAHHLVATDLAGVAVCNPATGQFDVTWTFTNSFATNWPFTIDSNTRGLTFGTNPVAQGGTSVATESVVGTATLTLTVTGRFIDPALTDPDEPDSVTASVTPGGTCDLPPVVPPPPEQPPVPPVVGPPSLRVSVPNVEPTLPATGTSATLLAALGLAILLIGAGIVALSVHHRPVRRGSRKLLR